MHATWSTLAILAGGTSQHRLVASSAPSSITCSTTSNKLQAQQSDVPWRSARFSSLRRRRRCRRPGNDGRREPGCNGPLAVGGGRQHAVTVGDLPDGVRRHVGGGVETNLVRPTSPSALRGRWSAQKVWGCGCHVHCGRLHAPGKPILLFATASAATPAPDAPAVTAATAGDISRWLSQSG